MYKRVVIELDHLPLDVELMRRALEAARVASSLDEVPVGAVIWYEDSIVACRHNEKETTGDPTAHAEMLALRDAADKIGSWRLSGAVVAVTLEPCCMCAGALQQARVSRVVYGAADPKGGALGSLYNFAADPRLNHEFEVVHGVLGDESSKLLKDFFCRLRV